MADKSLEFILQAQESKSGEILNKIPNKMLTLSIEK